MQERKGPFGTMLSTRACVNLVGRPRWAMPRCRNKTRRRLEKHFRGARCRRVRCINDGAARGRVRLKSRHQHEVALFCSRFGLYSKGLGRHPYLQILGACQSDKTQDQNNDEKDDGDMRPGDFRHGRSVSSRLLCVQPEGGAATPVIFSSHELLVLRSNFGGASSSCNGALWRSCSNEQGNLRRTCKADTSMYI